MLNTKSINLLKAIHVLVIGLLFQSWIDVVPTRWNALSAPLNLEKFNQSYQDYLA
jgi:hypothetical protein